MFEKFTEGAIKVIMLSQEEAREWVIILWDRTTFIRCYWSKTWYWCKSIKKIKSYIKKSSKRN
jgi:hypothetical protein